MENRTSEKLLEGILAALGVITVHIGVVGGAIVVLLALILWRVW